MDREQFTFYASFFRAVSRIKNKTARCDAYDAICTYALTGVSPDMDRLPDAAAIAFELSKPNLDASRRKAENGRAGGKQKQSGSKPEARANHKQEKEQEREQDKDRDKDREQMLNTPHTPLLGGSPALQEVFDLWLKYKREKRQDYKPTGLKSLVTQVQKAAETYGEQAVIDLIGECMANNWQGIMFDRLKSGQNHGKSGNVFLDIAREEGIV